MFNYLFFLDAIAAQNDLDPQFLHKVRQSVASVLTIIDNQDNLHLCHSESMNFVNFLSSKNVKN